MPVVICNLSRGQSGSNLRALFIHIVSYSVGHESLRYYNTNNHKHHLDVLGSVTTSDHAFSRAGCRTLNAATRRVRMIG